MKSQYSAAAIIKTFADIEEDDMHFLNNDGTVDRKAMADMGVYLVRLSMVTEEAVQQVLDMIDAPSLEKANDQAFGLMNALINRQY